MESKAVGGLDQAPRSAPRHGELNTSPEAPRADPGRFSGAPRSSGGRTPRPPRRVRFKTRQRRAERPRRSPCRIPESRPSRPLGLLPAPPGFALDRTGESGNRGFPDGPRQRTGQRRRRTAPGESSRSATEWPEPDRAQSPPARGRAGSGTASSIIRTSMPTRPKSTTIDSASTSSTTASSSPGS